MNDNNYEKAIKWLAIASLACTAALILVVIAILVTR